MGDGEAVCAPSTLWTASEGAPPSNRQHHRNLHPDISCCGPVATMLIGFVMHGICFIVSHQHWLLAARRANCLCCWAASPLQLYQKHAPKTCKNFLELARRGYYDGTIVSGPPARHPACRACSTADLRLILLHRLLFCMPAWPQIPVAAEPVMWRVSTRRGHLAGLSPHLSVV